MSGTIDKYSAHSAEAILKRKAMKEQAQAQAVVYEPSLFIPIDEPHFSRAAEWSADRTRAVSKATSDIESEITIESWDLEVFLFNIE